MATYLHPGVYVEEIPSGSRPIEGVPTSVVAFVGAVPKGPVGQSIPIGSFDDYAREFGPIASENDAMGLALQAFYLNGGKDARVCRLVGATSTTASQDVNGQGPAGGASTALPVLTISALNEGLWGNGVYFKVVKPDPDSLTFDLVVGHQGGGKFVDDESFVGLTLRADDDAYALKIVNGASRYVQLALGDAAEIDGASELYQGAQLTGGVCPATASYFDTELSVPMSLSLSLNGGAARLVTIDVAATLAGTDNASDGDVVADALQSAVQALGTTPELNSFTCIYSGTRRFELATAEAASAASVEVFGGALAEVLRLDGREEHRALLTGAPLATTADLFSNATTGLPSLALSLSLDIDEHGSRTVTLDLDPTSDLVGDNATDGVTVALAIENAVRALVPAIPSQVDFTCEYSSARSFVLRSGNSSPRRSGLSVTDGPLVALLGLATVDTPVLSLGRELEQGTATVIPIATAGPLGQGVALAGGTETAPTALVFGTFYSSVLRKVREVSVVVLPGQNMPEDGSGNPIIDQTLAHCEAMGNRIVIIDPPPALELTQESQVQGLSLPTSTYSVLYYPWVSVSNPLYNADTNPTAARHLSIAPSAMAAGMWSRIDARRGVWKAPAGVETRLTGVAGLRFAVEDLEQDRLNPLGVNCLRQLPNYGPVIWGARTLATKASPEWRYVPVRRTAIFIEQSIYGGIQWAVFEPNSHLLWSSLRTNIGAFMNGLFRAGAFQGETSNQAYFVRCGLGDTMTQGDIDRGQVIAIVGFAPLKPAEFVIVRIQQKVGQE